MGLKWSPHEANIQDGGKIVHVVLKYLTRSLLYKGIGEGSVDVVFANDITITLLYCMCLL
jgi:hypothetical protein